MPPAAPSPRPAAPDPLVALADRCVQCGLCLPTCPTYQTARIETESPRGRIALARAWALDAVAPSPAGDAHLDHCLGCRSCEAVCPAGVEYGALLLQARGRQRERRGAGFRRRVIETLAARPGLLSRLVRMYDLLRPWLPAYWRRLPPLPRPARSPATAEARSSRRVAAARCSSQPSGNNRSRKSRKTGCRTRERSSPIVSRCVAMNNRSLRDFQALLINVHMLVSSGASVGIMAIKSCARAASTISRNTGTSADEIASTCASR